MGRAGCSASLELSSCPLWHSIDPRHFHQRLAYPAAQSDCSSALGIAGSQQKDSSGNRSSKQRANEEGAHHHLHTGVQGLPNGGKGNSLCGLFWHVTGSLVMIFCLLVLSDERWTLQIQHGLFLHPAHTADGRPGADPRPEVHLSIHELSLTVGYIGAILWLTHRHLFQIEHISELFNHLNEANDRE